MKFSKTFTDNDIYFMDVISDKIIINNNYDGVLVLDSDLSVVKKINIFENMVIDISFKKDKEVVLYCYENQCLIHINIDTYAYSIMSLSEDLKEIILLSFYEWTKTDLILVSDNGANFVHVNLLDNTVDFIQKNKIEELSFSIYNDWNKLSGLLIHNVYPSRHSAVIELDNKMVLYNYRNNKSAILPVNLTEFYGSNIPSNNIFHDIEVENDYIAQVSERRASILCGSKSIILYPESQFYSFWRCGFIDIDKKTYLLLLMCNNSEPKKVKIEKYDIDKL